VESLASDLTTLTVLEHSAGIGPSRHFAALQNLVAIRE
jgi:hypothetical protein